MITIMTTDCKRVEKLTTKKMAGYFSCSNLLQSATDGKNEYIKLTVEY